MWLVQDVLDKTLAPVPAAVSKTTASSELPGHAALNASTIVVNEYWGTAAPGEWIEFELEKPTRLVGMIITVGQSRDVEKFYAEAHPSEVEITTTDKRGQVESTREQIPDQPEGFDLDIGRSDITQVRVTILDARGLTPEKHIALAAVEFFTR